MPPRPRWSLKALLLLVAMTAVAFTMMDRFYREVDRIEGESAARRQRFKAILRPAPAVRPVVLRHHLGAVLWKQGGEHDWVIRNEGKERLRVWREEMGSSSVVELVGRGDDAVVPPGGEVTVRVRWQARSRRVGAYVQEPSIATSDPSRARIILRVEGFIVPEVIAIPVASPILTSRW
jgi:hypothetical protein